PLLRLRSQSGSASPPSLGLVVFFQKAGIFWVFLEVERPVIRMFFHIASEEFSEMFSSFLDILKFFWGYVEGSGFIVGKRLSVEEEMLPRNPGSIRLGLKRVGLKSLFP